MGAWSVNNQQSWSGGVLQHLSAPIKQSPDFFKLLPARLLHFSKA